jgi:hypothetical protein
MWQKNDLQNLMIIIVQLVAKKKRELSIKLTHCVRDRLEKKELTLKFNDIFLNYLIGIVK